ncbi:MAG: Na+/H+ antiporter subunit E [Kiritimatiellae bacterium]|nr:Na+/H+ antiporter subunit E [Kiritimatiellia bacterium]
MKRLVLFVLSFVLWVLLVWPFDFVTGALRTQDVWVGAAVAAVVALVMRELSVERYGRWLNPVRYLWALAYLFVFAFEVIKANVDVAYRVLHPALPINPGIVKVRTRLRTPEGRTALANSITLTPGTMTVDVTDDGFLYIHWINVRTMDIEEATRTIIGRFEWFIERILE